MLLVDQNKDNFLIKKHFLKNCTVNKTTFHKSGILAIALHNNEIIFLDTNFIKISSYKNNQSDVSLSDLIFGSGKFVYVSYESSPIAEYQKTNFIEAVSIKGKRVFVPAHDIDMSGYGDYRRGSIYGLAFDHKSRTLYASSSFRSGIVKTTSFANDFFTCKQILFWKKGGLHTPLSKACINLGYQAKLLSTPEGILFASDYPEWGLLGYDDEIKIHKVRELHRFSPMSDVHLAVNDDGTEIGFRPKVYPYVSFSLLEERQDTVRSAHPEFREEAGDTFVNDWKRKTKPKVRVFSPQFMSDGEECLSVDVSDDGERVVFGSERHLCLTDGFGRVQWNVPMSEMAVAVNLSGNGKIVVVADYQGLIHWYSVQDGQLLLTLYSNTDAKRWIAYTPDGYFAASARDAEDLVGWLHEQEDSPFGRFEPLGDRRKSHRRPDLLRRIIQLGDAQAAKKELGLE